MIKRILFTVLLLIVVVVGSALGYLVLRRPKLAPAPSIQIERTQARLERGAYLFNVLCDCGGCHSARDFSRFDGPTIPGHIGEGTVFPPEMGLPGVVAPPNITPDKTTGIGTWTDGEKIRAIRDGVDKDGRALFPMMPYPYYHHMSDEDVYALVAYLDTLPPIQHAVPKTQLNFPVNYLIKSAPQPTGHVPPPDQANTLKYGEYLVTLGGCVECHTQEKNGDLIMSKRLAGGRVFNFPGASVATANITPDPDTGIGKWSEQQFLDKFYSYKAYLEKGPPKVGPESFTLMPWLGLSQLPPEDLKAIFAYLKSQPAIYNSIEKRPAAPAAGS